LTDSVSSCSDADSSILTCSSAAWTLARRGSGTCRAARSSPRSPSSPTTLGTSAVSRGRHSQVDVRRTLTTYPFRFRPDVELTPAHMIILTMRHMSVYKRPTDPSANPFDPLPGLLVLSFPSARASAVLTLPSAEDIRPTEPEQPRRMRRANVGFTTRGDEVLSFGLGLAASDGLETRVRALTAETARKGPPHEAAPVQGLYGFDAWVLFSSQALTRGPLTVLVVLQRPSVRGAPLCDLKGRLRLCRTRLRTRLCQPVQAGGQAHLRYRRARGALQPRLLRPRSRHHLGPSQPELYICRKTCC
jgi:hypothetical protein